MEKIRVLIAEDQAFMRNGLRTTLELKEDINVIGVAENGKMACELAKVLSPEVILMDIKMPVLDGIEATRRIKEQFPYISIVMITTMDEEKYIMEALYAGASGYLLKDMPGEDITEAVRLAAREKMLENRTSLSAITSRLFHLCGDAKKYILAGKYFTERELQIIQYMVQGFSNKKIASILYITEGTVKNYVSAIYGKIGIRNRNKAVSYLKTIGIA